jgi:hypothetical protein
MAKQILIVLHADGRLEANLEGFKGTECEKDELLKAIQAMLAPEARQEVKKPEYYQRQSERVKQES